MPVAPKISKTSDLDSQARRLTKDATSASFWGAITLDTNRVFVSKAAADISSAILKAGLSRRDKVDIK